VHDAFVISKVHLTNFKVNVNKQHPSCGRGCETKIYMEDLYVGKVMSEQHVGH